MRAQHGGAPFFRERQRYIEPIARRGGAHPIRPLNEAGRLAQRIQQSDLLDFARTFQPIKIGVPQRALRAVIGLDKRISRARDIFIPAGLTNTASYEADQLVDNLAQGYTTEGSYDGTRRTNIYSRPARGSAAGGGYSTTDDLFKFILAARAHKFGNASAAAYRMGIAGGAPGINADIESDLKGGFDIIVLSNYDPPTAIRLARELRVLASRVKE